MYADFEEAYFSSWKELSRAIASIWKKYVEKYEPEENVPGGSQVMFVFQRQRSSLKLRRDGVGGGRPWVCRVKQV